MWVAYVFDVRAGVDCDDVSVLDTKIVSHDTVQPCTTIIEIIIGQHDQHCVLSLFALNKDCITAE